MKTGLFHIADSDFWYKIEPVFNNSGGIYLLKSYSNDRPVPIHRLMSIDESGTLYIGKAISFLDRVVELKKSITEGYTSSNHDCGYRYKKYKLGIKYPYESLYVDLIGAELDKIDKLEKDIIEEYTIKFGELPPLNRNK